MAKRTLSQWLGKLNNYGRLRVFLSIDEAHECQQALIRMREILEQPETLAFLRKFSKEIEK